MSPTGRPIPLDLRDSGPNVANGCLAWSPDGTRIAALGVPGDAEGSGWIVEPGAAEPVRSAARLAIGVIGRGIAWAADGRSLPVGGSETPSDIVLFTRDR